MTETSSLLETAGSRTETDFMGARQIPAAAYWGIQTLRAVENFPITGIAISSFPRLVQALAQVKHAAVLANFDLGLINGTKKMPLCRPAGTSRRAACSASLLWM
jgi:aspartate ammonia-lyase